MNFNSAYMKMKASVYCLQFKLTHFVIYLNDRMYSNKAANLLTLFYVSGIIDVE